MTARSFKLAAALLAVTCAATLAADETFTVRLSPAPRDAAMRGAIAGSGSARVTLAGNELTIAGTFTGFVTPATRAELRKSPVVAARGEPIRSLQVTRDTSGSFAGSLTLAGADRAAFDAGRLYIEIATESAPEGNVWGWLLPASAPLVRDR
jgi:hypothetical protein